MTNQLVSFFYKVWEEVVWICCSLSLWSCLHLLFQCHETHNVSCGIGLQFLLLISYPSYPLTSTKLTWDCSSIGMFQRHCWLVYMEFFKECPWYVLEKKWPLLLQRQESSSVILHFWDWQCWQNKDNSNKITYPSDCIWIHAVFSIPTFHTTSKTRCHCFCLYQNSQYSLQVTELSNSD